MLVGVTVAGGSLVRYAFFGSQCCAPEATLAAWCSTSPQHLSIWVQVKTEVVLAQLRAGGQVPPQLRETLFTVFANPTIPEYTRYKQCRGLYSSKARGWLRFLNASPPG